MDNNNQNNSCQFAEQIVSYIYGESTAGEKLKFESHLGNCPNCADELAGFGFVRSAVLDWRTKVFSHLDTSFIEIPTIKSNTSKISFAPAIVSSTLRSRFGELKKIFSFNPAMATAALAVFVVCLGLTLYMFNFSGETEIAENNDNVNLIQAIVSPTIDISEKPEEINKSNGNTEKSLSVAATDLLPETKVEKRITPRKSAVKVSLGSVKNNTANAVRPAKETNDITKKTSPVRKQPIPNLNDTEDEEDETIRLADLFDELDTR